MKRRKIVIEGYLSKAHSDSIAEFRRRKKRGSLVIGINKRRWNYLDTGKPAVWKATLILEDLPGRGVDG